MSLRFPLALGALLALAACGPPNATDDAPGTARGGDPQARPDTAMVREVSPESTLDFVAGDLLTASPSVAIQTLDLWMVRLDTVSGAGDVRGDLETLRNLLQSSPLDGPAIGRTMQDLGDGTEALAKPGTALARLAATLRQQGGRLVPDTTATPSAGDDVTESEDSDV